jgi:hypothetical protein
MEVGDIKRSNLQENNALMSKGARWKTLYMPLKLSGCRHNDKLYACIEPNVL